MGMDIDFVVARREVETIKFILESLPHGERSDICDDLTKITQLLAKKYDPSNKLQLISSEEEDYVLLPVRLTAENGGKGILLGEFFETVQYHNPDPDEFFPSDDTITQKVPVRWTTIKDIYTKIVNHFAELR